MVTTPARERHFVHVHSKDFLFPAAAYGVWFARPLRFAARHRRDLDLRFPSADSGDIVYFKPGGTAWARRLRISHTPPPESPRKSGRVMLLRSRIQRSRTCSAKMPPADHREFCSTAFVLIKRTRQARLLRWKAGGSSADATSPWPGERRRLFHSLIFVPARRGADRPFELRTGALPPRSPRPTQRRHRPRCCWKSPLLSPPSELPRQSTTRISEDHGWRRCWIA